MHETHEKNMKYEYIEFDYEDIYKTANYSFDIIDETNLIIDECSYQKFLSSASPFYKKGWLKKGYVEAPPSFLSNMTRFLSGIGRLKLNDELKLLYINLKEQTDELCAICNNKTQLEPTSYEVIGMYFNGNIRASRIFSKYAFQAPKVFFSDILRFTSTLEHIGLNPVAKRFNDIVRQETLQAIVNRERTFRKIRKNLINYINNIDSNYSISVDNVVSYEMQIKRRCITILIHTN